MMNNSSEDLRGTDTVGDADARRPRWVLWLSLLALALFVGWAALAEIDQVTRAPALVIASSRNQLIQASDAGTLEALLVREGDRVVRGQLLVRFSKTRLQAASRESMAKQAAAQAAIARLQAELFGGQPVFGPQLNAYPEFRRNQLALLAKRRSAIDEEIRTLQRQLVLAQRELGLTEPLLAAGDVGQSEVLRLQRQVVEIQGQLAGKRNKYLQELQTELAKMQEELSAVEQVVVQRQQQLDQTELRAQVNGIVRNIRVNTVGGVVRAGEEVMQIVPVDDALVLEAKVRPADVAFLKPGLPVNVKIDAYDYTLYGSLEGVLEYLSADTVTEELRQNEPGSYRARIRIVGRAFSGRPDQVLDLQPGMTAVAEIRTGKATVLRYLVKPVLKTLDESLGER